jgi:polyphenol oxidase
VGEASLEGRAQSSRNGFIAAIGPSISVDAFEVGDEVVDEFAKVFSGDEMKRLVRQRAGAKPHIDLREALAIQLIREGVPRERIDMTDRCTVRNAAEFFSHRRDQGVTGRLAAFIAPSLPSPVPPSPTRTPLPTLRSSPASRP